MPRPLEVLIEAKERATKYLILIGFVLNKVTIADTSLIFSLFD